jgi:carboxyl-terminal processing protease
MGIRTGTLRRAAAGAALLAVLVAGMPAPGRAAADSLVLAALHTLETSYVEPVDASALLDAAIAALRQATGLGEDLLPGIPPGTGAAQATAAFSSAFDRAIAAGRLDPRHLAFAATAGMLASLHDSHTYFLDPARFREEQETLRGAAGYSGIGVLLASVDDGTGGRLAFVAYVFPGSPAARAGLRRFDRIVGVDGWPLRRASVEELVRALRGPVGTPVALSVRRGDRVFDVQVTRAPIRIPPVEARLLAGGTAYVKLFGFSRGTTAQLRGALGTLAHRVDIHALILDLRSNGGGLLVEASGVAGLFLTPGTVIGHVEDRLHHRSTLRAVGEPLFRGTPLVVLTNKETASSAELLAQALRDEGRATLVGEHTAGALGGSTLVPLPEGGMSVTVERITGARDERIEGVGITPDRPIALTATDVERERDPQLDAARSVAAQLR